jgi:uncharacterized membrane protein
MVQEFEQIGFGQGLRYLTGILEVSGAVGLLIPKVRFRAALLIACIYSFCIRRARLCLRLFCWFWRLRWPGCGGLLA